MSLLDRVKNVLTDKEIPTQPRDYRVLVKAIRSIRSSGIEAGKTYLMSPSDAHYAHVSGWGEVLDRVPGFNAPLAR